MKDQINFSGESMSEVNQELIKKALNCVDCGICKRARVKQKGIAYFFVKYIDRKVCPDCKAFEKVFNRPAFDRVSEEEIAEMRAKLPN